MRRGPAAPAPLRAIAGVAGLGIHCRHTGQTDGVSARAPVLLLATGFVVVLGIVVMTSLLAERSRAYFDFSLATRDQRTAAVELRNALLVAESSQRGFVIGGDEVYLAPFGAARAEATRWLNALERSVAADPEAQAPVARLRALTTAMLDDMAAIVALKRDRQDAAVIDAFRASRGKAMMDEAGLALSGLVRAADDRLTDGIADQRRISGWLRLATLAGGMAIVAIVGGATLSVLRRSRALASAHGALATLNTGLEATVAERTTDLAQAGDEIQRFAYIVTHDLRAPLVNILGFTGELEEAASTLFAAIDAAGGPDGLPAVQLKSARVAAEVDLPEAIHLIRSSTRKMDDLIEAILTRAREGRRALRLETVDLGAVVEAAAALVRHQIQSGGGMIEQRIEVPPLVIDRLSLGQVIGNLLDNAVKERSPARPLAIAVRARAVPGDAVEIEIEDNGRDIDARDLTRVVDPFRRAGMQDQPGEGIGLAVVKVIVRRMSGTISMRSVLNSGTTFTIVLPRAQRDAERMASPRWPLR